MYFYKKCFILLIFLIFCNLKSNIKDVRILQAPDGRIFIFLGDIHILSYYKSFKTSIDRKYEEKFLSESDYKQLINLQSKLYEKINNLDYLQSQQIINFVKKFQKILSVFVEGRMKVRTAHGLIPQGTIIDNIANALIQNNIGVTNLEVRIPEYLYSTIYYELDNLILTDIKNMNLKNITLDQYYAKIIQKYESLQKILKNKKVPSSLLIPLLFEVEMLAAKIFDKNAIFNLINSKQPLNLTIAGAKHCELITQQLIGAYNFKEIFNLTTEEIKDDPSFFGILYKLFLANKYDEIKRILNLNAKTYETFEKIDLQKLLEQRLAKHLQIKSKL